MKFRLSAPKEQTNWELGVSAPLGAGVLRASYQRADASGGGTDANDARQVALGYQYNLSKRTAVYTAVSRLKNSGAAGFVVAIPPAAAPGGRSRGFEAGLMHAF